MTKVQGTRDMINDMRFIPPSLINLEAKHFLERTIITDSYCYMYRSLKMSSSLSVKANSLATVMVIVEFNRRRLISWEQDKSALFIFRLIYPLLRSIRSFAIYLSAHLVLLMAGWHSKSWTIAAFFTQPINPWLDALAKLNIHFITLISSNVKSWYQTLPNTCTVWQFCNFCQFRTAASQ